MRNKHKQAWQKKIDKLRYFRESDLLFYTFALRELFMWHVACYMLFRAKVGVSIPIGKYFETNMLVLGVATIALYMINAMAMSKSLNRKIAVLAEKLNQHNHGRKPLFWAFVYKLIAWTVLIGALYPVTLFLQMP